jgi:hypothetical protein
VNIFQGFLLLMKKFLPKKQGRMTFTTLTAAVWAGAEAVQPLRNFPFIADRPRKVKLSELYINVSNYLFSLLSEGIHKW